MRLSSNPHAKSWLDQFDFQDRETARELLDSIEYISTNKFRSEIESQLVDIVKAGDKIAIFPARELIAKNESYFPSDLNEIQCYLRDQGIEVESQSLKKFRKKKPGTALTKKDFDGFSPVLQKPNTIPGSEALVAHIITQLKRRFGNFVVTGKGGEIVPSIEVLRREKCRKIVVVDDVIGSGKRISDFIQSIVRNKTINSWVSGGIVKIVVVSYMKSQAADVRLSKLKQKIELQYFSKFPTFHEYEDERFERIKALVNKYSDKEENIPLGFDEVFGRAVFEHSVPNNIPPILWRSRSNWQPSGVTSHSGQWEALFVGRSISVEFKEAVNSRIKHSDTNRQRLTTVLSTLQVNTNINTPRRLARHLEWDTSVCKDLLKRLSMLGFIDASLRITTLGSKELDYLLKNHSFVEFNTDNYYPANCG